MLVYCLLPISSFSIYLDVMNNLWTYDTCAICYVILGNNITTFAKEK
jgi:hypothetical protein